MAYADGVYAHVPSVAASGASEAEKGVCEFELSKEIEDERELYKIVAQDFWGIFTHELKTIFCDGGVLIIFFVAGLGYPLLYNLVYRNGILEDTPIAVVDRADCSESRRYIRKVDATRELSVAYRCTDMEQARRLMEERKVNGIIYFPADFGERLARMETAKLSVYADMSSFLYYKNLLMGSEFVMLDEVGKIQVERYSAAGFTGQESSQLVKAIPYGENLPYNRTFSYSIFLISAILLLIVQQVMFYGMSLLAGTAREENRSFATLPDSLHGRGVSRVVFGRGAAYWLLFMGLGIYIACIVPALCGFPQRGSYRDICGAPDVFCDGLRVFLLGMEHVYNKEGIGIRIASLHVSGAAVPYRVLMAGIRLSAVLEMVFIPLPVNVRMPGIHKHKHSRL